jgi:hypothetical protein
MAGILNFANYIGGPDDIQVVQTFPSSSKILTYDFGQSVADWTYVLEYQTIVVDPVTFDRNSGLPNFAASQVIGTFPVVSYSGGGISAVVRVANTASGIVSVTHPANMYDGPILPDARSRVPMTVVSLTWTDAVGQTDSHRYCYVMAWEPGVTSGDPTGDGDYNPLTLAG